MLVPGACWLHEQSGLSFRQKLLVLVEEFDIHQFWLVAWVANPQIDYLFDSSGAMQLYLFGSDPFDSFSNGFFFFTIIV